MLRLPYGSKAQTAVPSPPPHGPRHPRCRAAPASGAQIPKRWKNFVLTPLRSGDYGAKDLLALGALAGVLGQKRHANAVIARGGQGDLGLAGDEFEEFVWRLDEDAGAIAGIGFAPTGTAVVEVEQHLKRLLDNCMGLAAFDVDHKPDPAGFVFKPRVVQALLGRRTDKLIRI